MTEKNMALGSTIEEETRKATDFMDGNFDVGLTTTANENSRNCGRSPRRRRMEKVIY